MKLRLNKKKKLVLFFATILIFILLISVIIKTHFVTKIINNINKQEQIEEFSYETKAINDEIASVLITFYNENGIKQITYPARDGKEPQVIYPRGKNKISIDYNMSENNSYTFNVEYENNNSKEFTVNYEFPRVQGNYILSNGVYVNEPDVTQGFNKSRTRYMYPDDSDNLIPGNWITDSQPDNWYSYKDRKWANIYVEDGGVDSYYVWIPRYVYKLDATNQRSDIKFVNVYNEYIDARNWNENNMERA